MPFFELETGFTRIEHKVERRYSSKAVQMGLLLTQNRGELLRCRSRSDVSRFCADEGMEVKTHEETHISCERSRCVHRVRAFAGAVYAQTATSTTSGTSSTTATTTTANSATAENGLVPFFGPLLGKTNQNQNLNTVCRDRAVRHEVINWYQQLPTDQKNALQNNLKEAFNSWYNQLPQGQKDNLQSILNQTNETA